MTEPRYHPEARGLAFNVKDRCHYQHDQRGDDTQRDIAYRRAQRAWWHDARDLAIRHGFDDIGCCGRSGGWAFPVPVADPSDARTDPDGWAETLARVEALGADIDNAMHPAALAERFTAALDDVIADDAEDIAARNAIAIAEREALAILREVASNDVACTQLRERARDVLAVLDPEA